MIILTKVMHTSRELDIADMQNNLAKQYEKVLSLKPESVNVILVEHPEKKPCKTNPVPHCHYAVTINYDETNTIDKT